MLKSIPMRRFLITTCLCAIALPPLHADTIVLKSGKKLEGRVISQDAKSYLLEINVTPTIKDERRVPKDQVEEILKEATDGKEFKKVAALVPTPDLLPVAAYGKRIAIARGFVSAFPKSSHIADAKKILATLEKEHGTISAGSIKLDGQLIAQPDMEANAYEIHARMILRDIARMSQAQQFPEALRKWETLRSDYRNSDSFGRAVPVARRVLRSYGRSLKQLADTLDERTAQRKSALESMKDSDRQRTEAALADKQRKLVAAIAREKDQLKLKWLSVDPFDKSSIEHSKRLADTALDALAKLDTTGIRPAGSSHRAAWTALAKDDLESAAEHVKTLESLRIPGRYLKPLQDRLAEKQQAHKAAMEKAREEAAEKARQEKLAKEAAEKAAAEKTKKKPKGKKRK